MTTIPSTTCPTEIGQIQRFVIVRSGGVRFDTTDPTTTKQTPATIRLASYTPDTVAPWTVLTALADSDKTLFTPLIGGDPQINPQEPLFFGGGDNQTLNGEKYFVKFLPSDGTARFDSLTAAQTKALKELACESSLEIFLINDSGDIIGKRDPNDSDLWYGMNVSNFTLGGRSVQGFATRDSNTVTFQLDDDWDESFEAITPTDFNALTVF
jgi:hypothetical protein